MRLIIPIAILAMLLSASMHRAASAEPAADDGKVKARADALLAGIDHFQLDLKYIGMTNFEDHPLQLHAASGPSVNRPAGSFGSIPISVDQAKKVIAELQADGFIATALDDSQKPLIDEFPTFTLQISSGGDSRLWKDLGPPDKAHAELAALRKALDGEAAETLDGVLAIPSDTQPATQPDRVLESEKGWDVFIYDSGGQRNYSLLRGTNRLKTPKEIAAGAVQKIADLQASLARLKEGQQVFLHGDTAQAPAPADAAKIVRDYCKSIGLDCQSQSQ